MKQREPRVHPLEQLEQRLAVELTETADDEPGAGTREQPLESLELVSANGFMGL